MSATLATGQVRTADKSHIFQGSPQALYPESAVASACNSGGRLDQGHKAHFLILKDALHSEILAVAVQDAIEFAQRLRALADKEGGGAIKNVSSAALEVTLREYEQARLRRALPIVLKSYVVGQVLRIESPPVSPHNTGHDCSDILCPCLSSNA